MYNGEQLLKQLVNLVSKADQGKICVGSETLALSTSVKRLASIPVGATSADMTLECAAGSTSTNVGARYSISSTAPSATISAGGMPIGDYDTIEISHESNLTAFQVISADAVTKYLKIIYYK